LPPSSIFVDCSAYFSAAAMERTLEHEMKAARLTFRASADACAAVVQLG